VVPRVADLPLGYHDPLRKPEGFIQIWEFKSKMEEILEVK